MRARQPPGAKRAYLYETDYASMSVRSRRVLIHDRTCRLCDRSTRREKRALPSTCLLHSFPSAHNPFLLSAASLTHPFFLLKRTCVAHRGQSLEASSSRRFGRCLCECFTCRLAFPMVVQWDVGGCVCASEMTVCHF